MLVRYSLVPILVWVPISLAKCLSEWKFHRVPILRYDLLWYGTFAEERNFTDCDYTDGDNCEHIFYVPPDGSAESVMIDEGRSKQPIFSPYVLGPAHNERQLGCQPRWHDHWCPM